MQGTVDFRQLVDTGPAVHYVAATADFAHVYVSRNVRAVLGYAPEQFTQDAAFWASRIHPDDQTRVLGDLETMFGRNRYLHEYRFLHADGSWRWLRDELVLVRNDDGQTSGLTGSWLDITDLKTADEELVQLSGRLRESQRIAGIGSWEIDVASSTGWWSDETFRIFGEEPSAYLPSQQLFVAKIHPDDRPRFTDTLQKAVVDGKPYSIDYRILLQDGTEKVINGRGRCVASEGGRATRFAGTVQDISQRTRAEKALRDAEARNRALLEANPDVIFRIDADGRYLDLSLAATTPFPFTKGTLIGRNVAELYGPEFAREHQEYVRKAIDTNRTQVWQHRMPLPTGDMVDLESRFVRSGEHEAVVTVRDVTERVALQRDLVTAQERERRLIGHDLHDGLGQELTGISLALEVLAQALIREESAHAKTVQNLRALVQHSISRTHRIAIFLAPEFGNGLGSGKALTALASNVESLGGVKCRVERDGEDHAHHIDIDANLYRIAQECLTNALKHGRPSVIELHYSCDGKTVRLEVLDDGVGIDSQAAQAEGMGMRGMRYRAQLLDGRVEVGRAELGGARVAFSCACRRP